MSLQLVFAGHDSGRELMLTGKMRDKEATLSWRLGLKRAGQADSPTFVKTKRHLFRWRSLVARRRAER